MASFLAQQCRRRRRRLSSSANGAGGSSIPERPAAPSCSGTPSAAVSHASATFSALFSPAVLLSGSLSWGFPEEKRAFFIVAHRRASQTAHYDPAGIFPTSSRLHQLLRRRPGDDWRGLRPRRRRRRRHQHPEAGGHEKRRSTAMASSGTRRASLPVTALTEISHSGGMKSVCRFCQSQSRRMISFVEVL